MAPPSDDLKPRQDAFQSMFNSKEHSDLEIHCKDGTLIYAHKAIVCPKSKFFANACKPGHFREGVEGIAKLEFGDGEDIKDMLGYIYTIDPQESNGEVFDRCARLYEVADFYDVLAVRTRAIQIVKYYDYDTPNYIHKNQISPDFVATIRRLYATETPGENPFCDILARATASNLGLLLYSGEVTPAKKKLKAGYDTWPNSYSELQDTMVYYPEFGRDVALASGSIMRTTEQEYKHYTCQLSNCKKGWVIEVEELLTDNMWCPHCGGKTVGGGQSKDFECVSDW